MPDIFYNSEGPPFPFPKPSPVKLSPTGFVFLPISCHFNAEGLDWWIYHQALANAIAENRPSIIERDLLGVWN